MIYDWVWESADFQNGWLVAAADNLFASLAMPLILPNSSSINPLLNRPLHFIGHSRGSVVNALVTNLIGSFEPFQGVAIDQVTSLDTHPTGGLYADPYSAAPNTTPTFANVEWADSYWRTDGFARNVNGEQVIGARNVQLVEDRLQQGGWGGNLFCLPVNAGCIVGEHADVHLWYTATINTEAQSVEEFDITAEDNAGWWERGVGFNGDAGNTPDTGRDNIGYAYSRIAGGNSNRSPLSQELTEPSPPSYTLFNGDFSFRSTFDSPGWARHGGGKSGIANITVGKTLSLGAGGALTHNPFWLRNEYTVITLDYRLKRALFQSDRTVIIELTDPSDPDGTPAEIGRFIVSPAHGPYVWQSRLFEVLQSWRGRVWNLTVRLDGPPSQFGPALIEIDNIRFGTSTVAAERLSASSEDSTLKPADVEGADADINMFNPNNGMAVAGCGVGLLGINAVGIIPFLLLCQGSIKRTRVRYLHPRGNSF